MADLQHQRLKQAIAAGHRRFAETPEPREEDEGGSGEGDFRPEHSLLNHPKLMQTQQFDGIDNRRDSPLPAENPDAEKALQLQKQQQLEQKMQEERKFNPTPGSFSR